MNDDFRIPGPGRVLLRWSRQLLPLLAILLVAGNLQASMPIPGASPALAELSREQHLIEDWGIELIALRSTAAGNMIDFRYRVVDAKKAAPLFVRKTKPYLLHQASGMALAVPNTSTVGSLRNSYMPQEGRVYWMFFGNLGRVVNPGDRVTVAIGKFRVTDIEVE